MGETDKRKRKAKRSRPSIHTGKYWFYILGALCLAVFLFAGYQVVSILTEYQAGQDEYNQLSQYLALPGSSTNQNTNSSDSVSSDAANSDVQTPDVPSGDTSGLTDWDAMDQNKEGSGSLAVVNFDALLKINDDVVGWIYFPTLDINYPVVQGETNNTYLYRTVNGKSNGAGSIFMDYRNFADMSDPHTILYGHHMNDGSMFADLVGYKKQEFYEQNPVFQYITPGAHYEVEVISAYVANVEQNAWKLSFSSEEDTEKWINQVLKRSTFDCEYEYSPGDQFMTLSTCTYEFENARFVVTGVIRMVAEG